MAEAAGGNGRSRPGAPLVRRDSEVWRGSWTQGPSPFFENGTESFPILPRTEARVDYEEETDEALRMARYHSLRSGCCISAVANNPSQDVVDIGPLVLVTPPGLSDAEIGVDALRRYVQVMGPMAQAFEESLDGEREGGKFGGERSMQLAEQEAEQGLAECKRVVPAVFFLPEFDVTDPKYFGDLAGRRDSMLLQEQLSLYLDMVEISLQKQIQARSHSFFVALLTIQDLHHQVHATVDTIEAIRGHMAQVRERLVRSSLGTLRSRQRAANLVRLRDLVERVAAVVRTSATIRALIQESNFTVALQMIAATQRILRTELVGVQSMRFMDKKLTEMTVLMEKMITHHFVEVALHGSDGHAGEHVWSDQLHAGGGAAPGATQGHKGAAGGGAAGPLAPLPVPATRSALAAVLVVEEGARDSPRFQGLEVAVDRESARLLRRLPDDEVSLLRQDVMNLDGLGRLAVLREGYREGMTRVLTHVLQDVVVSQLNVLLSGTQGDALPAEQQHGTQERLQELQHDQFMHLLRGLFHALVCVLSRMAAVRAVIAEALVAAERAEQAELAAAGAAAAVSTPAAPATASAVAPAGGAAAVTTDDSAANAATGVTERAVLRRQFRRDFSGLIANMCEFAHQKCSRILAAREPLHACLQRAQMRELFDCTLGFVLFSEQVCHKGIFALRGCLASQAKLFLDTFHRDAMERLGDRLDHEKWRRAAVRRKYQVMIDRGLEAPERERRVFTILRPPSPLSIEAMAASNRARAAAAAAAATILGMGPATTPASATAAPKPPGTVSLAVKPVLSTTLGNGAGAAGAAGGSGAAAGPQAGAKAAPAQMAKGASGATTATVTAASSTKAAAPAAAAAAVNPAAAAGASAAAALPGSDEDDDDEEEGAADGDGEKASRVLFVVSSSDSEKGKTAGGFEKFPVVRSLLFLVELVTEYLACAADLEGMATEVLHRLVELVKAFNSRSCQLVLGAGAMHVAQLESINGKHLALAAQCLGLVMTQVPVMRRSLAKHMPENQHALLVSLDRALDDYREHQKEIFAKLASIVHGLVERTCRLLANAPWATGADKGPAAANLPASGTIKVGPEESVKALMRQTVSLHRVLSDLLPPSHRDQIFSSIAGSFSALVTKYLQPIDLRDRYSKAHRSVNVSHMLKRLRSLDGLGPEVCPELENFVLKAPSGGGGPAVTES